MCTKIFFTIYLFVFLVVHFATSHPYQSANNQPLKAGKDDTTTINSEGLSNGTLGPDWVGSVRRCWNQSERESLNTCLRLIAADLKPRLSTGVPEINLPAIDPLLLKNIGFRHKSGPINLIADFSNVETTGLSKYDRSNFTVDMDSRILNFDLEVPQMQVTGNYELSGNLFLFPIGGTGEFWLYLAGVNSKGKGILKIDESNGRRTLQLDSIDLDFNVEGMKVHLTNLFNGDQFLGTVMNNFINENSKEIFLELRPQVGRRIAEMIKIYANKVLQSLSSEISR